MIGSVAAKGETGGIDFGLPKELFEFGLREHRSIGVNHANTEGVCRSSKETRKQCAKRPGRRHAERAPTKSLLNDPQCFAPICGKLRTKTVVDDQIELEARRTLLLLRRGMRRKSSIQLGYPRVELRTGQPGTMSNTIGQRTPPGLDPINFANDLRIDQ